MKTFSKSFTQQEPIPQAGILRATELMQTGRLHRYNLVEGETSEVSLLEQEFAHELGVSHCLACASGGYAMHIALKAAGLQAGDSVLTNAFTLAPVPGAIHNAGGKAVLVDIDVDFCVDVHHLEALMQTTQAKFFMLSHMRGHLADMDKIVALCKTYHVTLIEDCAHTMGAYWDDKASGTFGDLACFSTQTYKHMNSGEGGLLTTNNATMMARAVIYSGSYMLYARNGTVPTEKVFNTVKLDTPNYSGRMDNVRAAMLRAQLPLLHNNCKRWNERYQALETILAKVDGIIISVRPDKERYVGSSIQFRIPELDDARIQTFINTCSQQGVELKWFGDPNPQGFTSRYDSWRYLGEAPTLPNTLAVLKHTFDMRIPLTFSVDDMLLIGDIIAEVLIYIRQESHHIENN